eukprot:tig00020710_g13394.t1
MRRPRPAGAGRGVRAGALERAKGREAALGSRRDLATPSPRPAGPSAGRSLLRRGGAGLRSSAASTGSMCSGRAKVNGAGNRPYEPRSGGDQLRPSRSAQATQAGMESPRFTRVQRELVETAQDAPHRARSSKNPPAPRKATERGRSRTPGHAEDER